MEIKLNIVDLLALKNMLDIILESKVISKKQRDDILFKITTEQKLPRMYI